MMRVRQRVVRRCVIMLDGSGRGDGFLRQPSGSSFEVYPAFDGRLGDVPPDVDMQAYVRRLGRSPRGGGSRLRGESLPTDQAVR